MDWNKKWQEFISSIYSGDKIVEHIIVIKPETDNFLNEIKIKDAYWSFTAVFSVIVEYKGDIFEIKGDFKEGTNIVNLPSFINEDERKLIKSYLLEFGLKEMIEELDKRRNNQN